MVVHPLDAEDMREDIIALELRKRMGSHNPAVGDLARNIRERLDAYEIHKLEHMVGCSA